MIRFILRLARREGRGSRRRLWVYLSAITLGVAALVAINSFRHNVAAAIHAQARELLGADLELSSRRPFDATVERWLDSLSRSGVAVSRATSFASMALAAPSGRTRLVEVRAVEGEFPYYGTMETDPPGIWSTLRGGRFALVDPALLVQLEAQPGDTLILGEARFRLRGTVLRSPGDVALRSAIGPRVYIPAAYLAETRLLRTGSLVRYLAFLKLEPPAAVDQLLLGSRALLSAHEVGYDTVAERETELTRSVETLARYLGLVGLVALLLGGVGVASAVNLFVEDKLDIAATLRCLGVPQRAVVALYLAQAAAMGLLGAAVGAGLGILIQWRLPRLLAEWLPLAVAPAVDWPSVAVGLGMGVWVALVFALLPLLGIRKVSPLAALRRGVEPPAGRAWADRGRWLAYLAIGASVLALAVWQAPRARFGLAFAAGVTAATGVLWSAALVLTRATRRFFPRRAGYVVRQGVANLFRPHNQTAAVVLAVGFGVSLVATLYLVQRNLLDQLQPELGAHQPNLVMFDIQQDQLPGVRALLDRYGAPVLQQTPIVTARIAAINGRPVTQLLADTASRRPSRWALRREYRNTYRDSLVASEQLVAGRWWRPGERVPMGRISVERDLAAELGVALGDRIRWDVQGVSVETEVASLRRVNWARFEPNFFVVFEPAVLARAPQSFVLLSRVAGLERRAELERDLVRQFPNVAALDLALVQQTLDRVVGSVSLAIRFMALFSIVSGLLVLAGSVATSRFQRMKEAALLKTLGASRRQVAGITVTEYLALGALAGLAGVGLAAGAAWALMRFWFEFSFHLPLAALTGLALGTAALTTAVGLANSWPVFTQSPLAVLRALGD